MNLSTITSNIREFAKDWKKAIMISIMNAIFITILTYVLDNQPLFTGENLSHYAFVELFKNKVMDSDNITNEKAFFINVAYDKQLVPYYENNLEEGNVVITDRTKLYDLLKKLQRVDNYRYVFLDIRFEKGIQDTLIDSKLFNEIKSMRNIVVATHKDSEIPDSKIISKTARSDYYYSILSTTFCRYIFRPTDAVSMSLFAYKELTGHDIDKHGILYSCDGKLCYNSLCIDFPLADFNSLKPDGNKNYYNMGSDILELTQDSQFSKLTKNKYIVIGDMVNDVHDTYSGKMPGAVINYRAFMSLMDGKHIVNVIVVLTMAFVFFLISMLQFMNLSLLSIIPFSPIKSKFLNFVLSFITYTVVLNIIVLLFKAFADISISVFVAILYLSVQKVIIKYKYQ